MRERQEQQLQGVIQGRALERTAAPCCRACTDPCWPLTATQQQLTLRKLRKVNMRASDLESLSFALCNDIGVHMEVWF